MENGRENQAGDGLGQKKQKPKRTGMIILLAVVVLALIIGGGYLYQRHKLSSYFDQVIIPTIQSFVKNTYSLETKVTYDKVSLDGLDVVVLGFNVAVEKDPEKGFKVAKIVMHDMDISLLGQIKGFSLTAEDGHLSHELVSADFKEMRASDIRILEKESGWSIAKYAYDDIKLNLKEEGFNREIPEGLKAIVIKRAVVNDSMVKISRENSTLSMASREFFCELNVGGTACKVKLGEIIARGPLGSFNELGNPGEHYSSMRDLVFTLKDYAPIKTKFCEVSSLISKETVRHAMNISGVTIDSLSFGEGELKSAMDRLGYKQVSLDYRLKFDYQAKDKNVSLAFEIGGKDTGVFKLDLKAAGFERDIFNKPPESLLFELAKASFAGVKISFYDKSITNRVIKMAAEEKGLSPEVFKKHILLSIAGMTKSNDDPFIAKLARELAAFIREPKSFCLEASPKNPIPFIMLSGLASSKGLSKVLGLKVGPCP